MKTMRTNLCLKPKEAMKTIKISSNTINSSNHHSSIIRSFSIILRTNTIKTFKGLKNTSQACNFCSNHFTRTCRNRKLSTWKRLKLSRPSKKNYGTTPIGFILKSEKSKTQDMLAREIQEIRKNQINQTLMSSQKADVEKNLEQAVERQARELAEMKKQLNLWTRKASAREAYSCWAHQQANPNLSEIPINHIPVLMQTNAEKGRPMFYGALKSHVGTSASSQSAQQEPIPLRTAPPLL
ncbi:hypothetical protein PIB30_070620, partial [Stylosanthes scabra]|nr:hypothetical protein [Stylosanthes scabra]